MKDISIIVPMYNEEKNVLSVFDGLNNIFSKTNLNYEFVFVDNGSHDKTQDLICSLHKKYPFVTLAVVGKNEGYGRGITTGLNNSAGRIIGYTDGDNQVPADTIIQAYNEIINKNLDYCFGKRKRIDENLVRTLLSKGYSVIFSLLFQMRGIEINSKPKLFKKELLPILNLKSKDWFIDTEIYLKTHKHKLKGARIEYTCNKRKVGKSNVHFSTIWEFAKNLLKYSISRNF